MFISLLQDPRPDPRLIFYKAATLNSAEDSITLNVKCKEIYLLARQADVGYELFAELTNIPTSSMFDLTGSGISSTGTCPHENAHT